MISDTSCIRDDPGPDQLFKKVMEPINIHFQSLTCTVQSRKLSQVWNVGKLFGCALSMLCIVCIMYMYRCWARIIKYLSFIKIHVPMLDVRLPTCPISQLTFTQLFSPLTNWRLCLMHAVLY